MRQPAAQRGGSVSLALVGDRLRARHPRLGPARRGPLDGAAVARPGGDRRRAGDAGRPGAALVRDRGRPARDLLALGLCAAGLAFLALTAGHGRESGAFTGSTMLAFEGGTLALVGVLLFASAHRRLGQPRMGAARGRRGNVDRRLRRRAQGARRDRRPARRSAVLSPWTAIAIVGGIGAFLALARGLQLGEPVAVIVAFSASATLAAITGGILVFGDPLGSDALDVIARSPGLRRRDRGGRAAAPGAAASHRGPRDAAACRLSLTALARRPALPLPSGECREVATDAGRKRGAAGEAEERRHEANGSAGVVNPRARQRALAIGIVRDGEHREDPLAELKELLRTAGVATAGELTQARAEPDPDRYLGRGQARRAEARDRGRRRQPGRLRRRAGAAPGAQPRAGARRAGDRPHRGDPRHLRRPRPHGRGQAPGRAGAARVQPRPHAGAVDAPRAPRRRAHGRRHRHPGSGRVPDRDRPPPGARPDHRAAAPAAAASSATAP